MRGTTTIELPSRVGPITVEVGRREWVFATPESADRWAMLTSDEHQALREQIWSGRGV